MRYLKLNIKPIAQKPPLPWWCKVLKKILPAANPDMEKYYYFTHVWWLEIDDKGKPTREIGFDENNNPICLAPIFDNYGLMVDSQEDWSASTEDSQEVADSFDRVWDELFLKFERELRFAKNGAVIKRQS